MSWNNADYAGERLEQDVAYDERRAAAEDEIEAREREAAIEEDPADFDDDPDYSDDPVTYGWARLQARRFAAMEHRADYEDWKEREVA
jgi:hypothetical protein